MTKTEPKVGFLKLSRFYFFYFAGLGAIVPYLSLYFQSLQFNALQIGILMGVMIGTKTLSPNLWGWLADISHKQVFWIQFTSFFSLIALAGLGILAFFPVLLGVMFVFSFFWHGALPLFEAYTFRALAAQKTVYGRIRLWGSIGFIVAVLGVGWGVEHWGIQTLPLILLSVMALAFFATLGLPEQAEKPVDTQKALSFWQIVKQPWIASLLVVSFLIQLSHGAYYSFYSIYLNDAGYSKTGIAWLWALGVIAEIGIFYYMTLLLHRWSAVLLLKVALFLTALRWVLIAEGIDYLSILLFAQLLHAASYGLFHAAAIYLIDHHFSGANQARGQAIYASISHGLGGGLGMFIAGVLWSHYGGEIAFLFSAVVVIMALLMVKEEKG